MLHDDRHIGFEYRRVIGVARYLLRVGKIIEPEVQECDGRRPLHGRGRPDCGPKKIVIATWASASPAFKMRVVSCEISARSENELCEGIYPSAIAHRLCPIGSIAWPFSADDGVNAGGAIFVSCLSGTFRRRGA